MTEIEAAAIAAGATTAEALMERAGVAAADAILAHWPELATGRRRAVVLCGPGANGGDGCVVARRLAERGWEVETFRFGDAPAAGAAATMRARWLALGPERPIDALAEAEPDADLMVDALFGTGLKRPVPQELFAAIARANALLDEDDEPIDRPPAWRRVAAIDAPLGLCLLTGRARPRVRSADLTVTFHRAKLGHFAEAGPDACGRLVVADIGLEPFASAPLRHHTHRFATLIERPTVVLRKSVDSHKYDYGHVLVLAGGAGRGGAARLAARAALRVGAGLVTVGAPGEAMAENAARLDAVMLRRIDDADDLRAFLEDRRVNALVMGPGLGVGERTERLLEVAADASPRGVGLVLDADALTTLAGARGEADHWEWRWRRKFGLVGARVVLTPHWGEFARLFGFGEWRKDDHDILYGLPQAVREAANVSSATVLLKGATTWIAEELGDLSIHVARGARAAPWLATAGSGDVLAGLVAGLLARGASAMKAAETAAWLHVEAARAAGPGLIAEDLPEALPAVFRALASGAETAWQALGAVGRVG